MFSLTITYPDGHEEELDESFTSLEKAVSYGMNLLAQIRATEPLKGKKYGASGKREAFFLVHKFSGKESELVFDSRNA